MAEVNNTLMRGLGSGLSKWLDKLDPNGIFSRMEGWYSGYYDANNNSRADDNEARSFFKELKGGDGKIYVLRLTPTANKPGNFDLTVSMRNALDGTLTVLDGSKFSENFSSLRSGVDNFELSVINLDKIDSLFSNWCRAQQAALFVPVVVRDTGNRFDREGFYAGWGYTSSLRDEDRHVADPSKNKSSQSIAGFGGGFVLGGSQAYFNNFGGKYFGGKYTSHYVHSVTPGEAYENYLAGGPCGNWWAAGQGINITSMTVNVNGIEKKTMGFTHRDTRTGYDITVYWDTETQTNMIGTVKSGGRDITEQVVGVIGGRTLGKTWADIRAVVAQMPSPDTVPSAVPTADPYNYGGDDQYSVVSQTGMVTPPSGAESVPLAKFKADWSRYVSNGVLTNLPSDEKELKRLFSDVLELLKANPGDLLRLFCGIPGGGNDVNAGMKLMSELFSQMRDTTSVSALMGVSEAIGRLTYLAGIQLAKAGRRDAGASGRRDGEYYRGVLTGLNTVSTSVIGSAFSSPLDIEQRKQLSQHYLLGLMNYDPATGRKFASTPEEAINVLVEHLRRAGALDTSDANRKTAADLSLFVRSVVQTLVLISELRTVDPRSDALASMVAMIQNVARTENYAQFLSTAFFGQLAAICSESSDARKYFEDQQGVQYEYSRKIQDAITTAFERALRAKGDAVKAMSSRN